MPLLPAPIFAHPLAGNSQRGATGARGPIEGNASTPRRFTPTRSVCMICRPAMHYAGEHIDDAIKVVVTTRDRRGGMGTHET
jgi:alpha/beta superfamily hydrolase